MSNSQLLIVQYIYFMDIDKLKLYLLITFLYSTQLDSFIKTLL